MGEQEIVKVKPRYKRVMYIEDNGTDRWLFEKVAEQNNLAEETIIFSTLGEAKEYITTALQQPESFPDLIFCDLMLGNDETALDFAKYYYTAVPEEVKKRTTLVVISAHTTYSKELSVLEHMMTAGLINHFFEKPVNKTPEYFQKQMNVLQ